MKKILSIVLVSILIMTNTLISHGKEGTTLIHLDSELMNRGVVSVGYLQPTDKRIRLLVEKEGVRYSYNLHENQVDHFPLQMGNGEYLIRVLENIEGNSYKEIYRKVLRVEMDNSHVVFLNSIQEIKWDKDSRAIKKAKELTKELKSDEEKVLSIYNYIINHISYDYEKIEQLSYLYLPNIDETLEDGKGLCYDYASLFAAMLRGVGIPTKMVKGEAQGVKGYHAWNEVYIKGLDEWMTMDTSYDAQMKGKKHEVKRYKSPQQYQGHKVY